jgi:hypothetical protein
LVYFVRCLCVRFFVRHTGEVDDLLCATDAVKSVLFSSWGRTIWICGGKVGVSCYAH